MAGDDNLSRNGRDIQRKPTPLPAFQLLITYLIQFAEPITATVVYPFAPHLVRSTGITGGDEKKTGYYAGIIESSFFFAESLSVYTWGKLSDAHGRRPILLLGPLGLAFSVLMFGTSTTFWSLVFFRCLQGVFNGNIGVSKTVIAEISDETNIATAYSYITLMWSTGVIIGPFLGGVLSNAGSKWPDSFGKIAYIRNHPYFLPCAVVATMSFAIFLISLLYLKESSPAILEKQATKKRVLQQDDHPNYGTLEAHPSPVSQPSPPLSTIDLLRHRKLLITLICYAFLTFCEMSYSALVPLMYSTSIELGGLGLQPSQIGVIMATLAIFSAINNVLFLARVLDRFGARNTFTAAVFALSVCMSCFPVLSLLAKRDGGVSIAVKVVLVFQLGCSMMTYLAYASIQILIVEAAPSKSALGATNGLGQMVATCFRALAPWVSSSLFSISLQYRLLGGNLVYLLLILFIFVGVRVSLLLPKKL